MQQWMPKYLEWLAMIGCGGAVWWLAPAESSKRHLREEQREKFRKWSIGCYMIDVICYGLAVWTKMDMVCLAISQAMLVEGILLVLTGKMGSQ